MAFRRVTGLILVAAVAAVPLGCAGGDETSAAAPATPLEVSASVTDDGISVKPERFGPGPILLTISNETARARSVTFRTRTGDDVPPALVQTTSPINPAGAAIILLDVVEGRYELSVPGEEISPADVRVTST